MWSLIFLVVIALQVLADNCYYPNGNVATDAFPCEGSSQMCCPNNWQCLSNGICHYGPEDTWGRYSCTDKSWGASCPKICNREVSQAGNEAIVQCSNGTWCCDTNHPELQPGGKSCCDSGDDSAFFQFGDNAIVFAVVESNSAVSTSEAAPTNALSTSQPSQGSFASNSLEHGSTVVAPPLSPSSRSTITVSRTPPPSASCATSDAAVASSAPNAKLPTSPASSSDSKTIGIAVAVPAAAIATCILSWLFYKKIKCQKHLERQATPFEIEQTVPEKQFSRPISNQASVFAPSELDSREIRIPISPQDVAHMSANNTVFERDETSNTLYPNAQPNYSIASPVAPQSASTTVSSAHDYSEWAVTPRLQQNRWSGTTAREDMWVRADERDDQYAQELMGRPRIPSTIAELP